MRYLGGKFRIGKAIADAIAPRGPWWEPFCGGLNVTRHLAAYGPGVVSDAHPALIALYQAVRAGWDPPEYVSREEYAHAKSLPDENPLKAFCGFPLSFGAKWFGGYQGERHIQKYKKAGEPEQTMQVDPVRAAQRVLRSDLGKLIKCIIGQANFLVEPVIGGFETLYCDPPYEGTTGYSTGAFDHVFFWAKCQAWARAGARVFVSEYRCPVPHELVWSTSHTDRMRRADGSQQTKTECLFRVLP